MVMFLISRNYEAESERKETVEEFYRVNHINQTYDFVSANSVSNNPFLKKYTHNILNDK